MIFLFVTAIPYRILIVPSRRGTMTSANVWIVLSGTLSETKRILVPKNSINFEVRVSVHCYSYENIY